MESKQDKLSTWKLHDEALNYLHLFLFPTQESSINLWDLCFKEYKEPEEKMKQNDSGDSK